MKKLIYLFILGVGFTSCSVESLDSTENLVVADMKVKLATQVAQDPMGFYSGGNGNLKGTFSVWNDCNNLYIEVIPTGDAPDGVKLGLFTTANFPADENGISEDMQYGLESANGLKWTFDLDQFDTESELQIFINAWGDWAGAKVFGTKNNAPNYHTFNFDFTGLECESVCESGYMFGDTPFLDLDKTAKNWGWGQEFDLQSGETVTMNIQQKDNVLGTVGITLNADGSVTLTEGPNVTITHTYVADARPTNTAPGQFDKIGNLGDANGNGKFWVMLKADICN